MSERVMSAPRMKRLGKVSLMTFADRKKFEGVEKPLRTFSLVTFSFWLEYPIKNDSCEVKGASVAIVFYLKNYFLKFAV